MPVRIKTTYQNSLSSTSVCMEPQTSELSGSRTGRTIPCSSAHSKPSTSVCNEPQTSLLSGTYAGRPAQPSAIQTQHKCLQEPQTSLLSGTHAGFHTNTLYLSHAEPGSSAGPDEKRRTRAWAGSPWDMRPSKRAVRRAGIFADQSREISGR
ncbi:hypothetical protein EJ03DRAFT_71404 [Teratosphaeria nubilosa]|uniref:Uncharacterized protein n=1 Tax=Teratosphaeria nubilosa TaxID=161662 RepID=A0A6G1LMQ2_9PEZI|nr:hypothetical protein EJ03DRAFT_71404 [Teratosphaeria nubilosa]